VFALSWLRVFGGEPLLRSSTYRRWVQRTLVAWAPVLDVVAMFDAPDPVLSHRIRFRAKPHMVKDQSDQQIAAFAARFRAAFTAVIPALTQLNGTRHLAVRADLAPPTALAARVLHLVRSLPT
jgi:hypothetical protein